MYVIVNLCAWNTLNPFSCLYLQGGEMYVPILFISLHIDAEPFSRWIRCYWSSSWGPCEWRSWIEHFTKGGWCEYAVIKMCPRHCSYWTSIIIHTCEGFRDPRYIPRVLDEFSCDRSGHLLLIHYFCSCWCYKKTLENRAVPFFRCAVSHVSELRSKQKQPCVLGVYFIAGQSLIERWEQIFRRYSEQIAALAIIRPIRSTAGTIGSQPLDSEAKTQ